MDFVIANYELIIQLLIFLLCTVGGVSATQIMKVKKILKMSTDINTILIDEIEKNKVHYAPEVLKTNIKYASMKHSDELQIELHDLVQQTTSKQKT